VLKKELEKENKSLKGHLDILYRVPFFILTVIAVAIFSQKYVYGDRSIFFVGGIIMILLLFLILGLFYLDSLVNNNIGRIVCTSFILILLVALVSTSLFIPLLSNEKDYEIDYEIEDIIDLEYIASEGFVIDEEWSWGKERGHECEYYMYRNEDMHETIEIHYDQDGKAKYYESTLCDALLYYRYFTIEISKQYFGEEDIEISHQRLLEIQKNIFRNEWEYDGDYYINENCFPKNDRFEESDLKKWTEEGKCTEDKGYPGCYEYKYGHGFYLITFYERYSSGASVYLISPYMINYNYFNMPHPKGGDK